MNVQRVEQFSFTVCKIQNTNTRNKSIYYFYLESFRVCQSVGETKRD